MSATPGTLHLWRSLIRAEYQRMRGDAFLLLLLGLMPIVALAMHQLWPVLMKGWPDWPWPRLAPFVSALLALLNPLIMGLVLGFQCLAEREAGILAAIRLTPAGLYRALLVRMSGYGFASVILTPLVHQWLGLVPLGWFQAFVIGVLALPLLPFASLLVLAFARSQVEGFAIMKATAGFDSIAVAGPDARAWLLVRRASAYLVDIAGLHSPGRRPEHWLALAINGHSLVAGHNHLFSGPAQSPDRLMRSDLNTNVTNNVLDKAGTRL